MSEYGMELEELNYETALLWLQTMGAGSGVMRMLRDSQGETHLRPFCLCVDTCDFDTRRARISESVFMRLRQAGHLTGNTYVGYNCWVICDFIPVEAQE